MKAKRRYLQFSLGTMFLAVTALCVWLGVQVRWMQDRREALKWLEDHDCIIIFQVDDPHDPFDDDVDAEKPSLQAAPWPIGLFGERGVAFIYLDEDPDLIPAGATTAMPTIKRLKTLFPEARVDTPLAPVMPP